MKTISIKDKIRNHFFDNPSDKLRVREIERKLSLPLPSVIRYCKDLEKEGILAREEIGRIVLFITNRGNDKFTFSKKLHNLKKIYDSGLIEYLKRDLSNPVIVLFGSFSRGEDVEESDIDLFIQTNSRKELSLGKFERKLKRNIEIVRNKDIGNLPNPQLANNIVNGTVLNGNLEVFK